MTPTKWQQYKTFFRHFLNLELADLERFVTPSLFSITVLLMFGFAFGEIGSDMQTNVYVAETFLTVFFAMQLWFFRLFEHEDADQAFNLLRIYPVSAEVWFLAKYLVVVLFGGLILLSTMLISAFFFQGNSGTLFPFSLYAIAFLAFLGMSAVGVLLSALVLKANAKHVLYPLIYFPLVSPLLIAAIQASLKLLTGDATIESLIPQWLGLVLIFDVIYFTLGLLLFGELLKSD